MKTALKQWYLEGGNNPYVQAWLDKGQALSYTVPNVATISQLNTFFDSLGSLISSAEVIRFYGLNDVNCGEISTLNFVNPNLYQATLNNSPSYSLKGYAGNASNMSIDEKVTANRRSGIETDFSSIAGVSSSSSVNVTESVFGVQTATGYINIHRPKSVGESRGWTYWGALTTAKVVSNHDGICSNFYDDNSSSAKTGRDGSYGTSIGSSAPDLSYPMYTLARNGAVVTEHYSSPNNVFFRWEGYALSQAEVELITGYLNTYRTALSI